MFGFHPFSTQTFSSAIPFVDVQTTTNLVSAAMGSGLPVATAVIVGTNLEMTSTLQTLPANSITVAIPEASTVLSGTLTFTLPAPSVFTYNDVCDNIGESWSDVVTTGTSETWSDV